MAGAIRVAAPSPEALEARLWEVFDRAFVAYAAQQVRDPGGPRDGAWILPSSGSDEPSQIGQGRLFCLLYLAWLRDPDRYGGEALLDALEACGSAWLRARRPSGRIDLRSCNPDSGPDTAFLLQQILACLQLGAVLRPGDPLLARALAPTETFAREALLALVDGGVHTPNHRWAIVSALAQGSALWPDLREALRPTLAAFVAEGPDLDAEGTFLERSVAVYDAVNVKCLLLTHEAVGWPEGLEAARRCLQFDLDLFHSDGTVDTQLSHRYDFGSRPVPLTLAASYLLYARIAGSPAHAQQAAWIFSHFQPKNPWDDGQIFWLALEVLRGNGFPAEPWTPPDFERFYPKNRIVRARRGAWSCSLYGGTNRLMSVVYGRASLAAVMAGQSYLGHGRFVSDELDGEGGVYRLVSRGRLEPHRLGYAQALGRPVDPERWHEEFARRELRAVPDCASRITCDWSAGGEVMTLLYETLDGLPGVPAQVTFDFPPGGIWETSDAAFAPAADQVIILKQGRGRMGYGVDWIEVDGGADAHRPWAMRDYPAPQGSVRVAVPLLTPVRQEITIRWGSGVG